MPILGVIASSYLQSTDTGSMFAIASTTVGTAVSNVTFTNIPSTYTHLEIRWSAQSSRGTYSIDDLKIQVGNSTIDTGNNYSWHQMIGTGTNPVTANNTTNTDYSQNQGIVGTTVGNTFGVGVTTILDYANTSKYKSGRTIGINDTNGQTSGFNGWIVLSSFNWRNTSAINTIRLSPSSGPNWTTGTRFSLYGIKG
jgi:hypothetical protein